MAEAFAAEEADKRGLSDAADYVAALLEETAIQNGQHTSIASFRDAKTDLEVLIRSQCVKPITDFDTLVADFWPEEESADDFLAPVGQSRQRPTPVVPNP